jgi:hypothetical protein
MKYWVPAVTFVIPVTFENATGIPTDRPNVLAIEILFDVIALVPTVNTFPTSAVAVRVTAEVVALVKFILVVFGTVETWNVFAVTAAT